MSAVREMLPETICEPGQGFASDVVCEGEASMPTEHGEFRILGFRSRTDGEEIVALVRGRLVPDEPTLVRVHSQCLTGDVFGSVRCDCGRQLAAALAEIARAGRGVVVYQQKEGRGIGIVNKIRAYALQDCGLDTVEANLALGFAADARTYGRCAAVLRALGVGRVRMMSNNPDKLHALAEAGLDVVERVPLRIAQDERFAGYLRTKCEKMGHLIELEAPAGP
jgi:3,4-dihydroxy 2-butanone 4-phosphate synthase / GTP cyclohydrolase II